MLREFNLQLFADPDNGAPDAPDTSNQNAQDMPASDAIAQFLSVLDNAGNDSTPETPTQDAAAQQPAADTNAQQTVQQAQQTVPAVALPSDILALLSQLALKGLGQDTNASSPSPIPEPKLPDLPPMPDILKPENRLDAYNQDPVTFIETLWKYNSEVERINAERERITKEYQAQKEAYEKQDAYTKAFVKQIRALGEDKFNSLADVATKILTEEMPSLSKLEPDEAVATAFQIAQLREGFVTDPKVKERYKAALRDEIIKEYVMGIAKNKTQPAIITGNIPGGKAPVMPPNRPKTLDEAGRQFKAFFNQQ